MPASCRGLPIYKSTQPTEAQQPTPSRDLKTSSPVAAAHSFMTALHSQHNDAAHNRSHNPSTPPSPGNVAWRLHASQLSHYRIRRTHKCTISPTHTYVLLRSQLGFRHTYRIPLLPPCDVPRASRCSTPPMNRRAHEPRTLVHLVGRKKHSWLCTSPTAARKPGTVGSTLIGQNGP